MRIIQKLLFLGAILLFPLCVRAQEIRTTETEVIATERGELTSRDILQKRDISRYDQGGHFDCHGWAKEPKDVCDEKRVRDFIWRHWTDKTRGYIRITYGSVDARSTSHIFIEPNDKNEWHISWRIARWHALPGGSNIVDDILDLVAVERIAGSTGNPDDWAVVIKRKTGKAVYTIPE